MRADVKIVFGLDLNRTKMIEKYEWSDASLIERR
jgi:hypothetical protein